MSSTLAIPSLLARVSDHLPSSKRRRRLSEASTSTLITSPTISTWPSTSLPHISSPSLFETMNGSRLHSFSQQHAPYPVHYNRGTLDYDVWDTLFFKELHGRMTLHDFNDDPPKNVLDLGTGSGAWVLEAANEWTQTTFVGFDLVDVQPKLAFLDETLAARVKWVHGNFLEPLPFASRKFDLVRMCRVAMGIPEDMWSFVIEEAVRVLKPGAILEVIEENLIFPYPRAPSRHRSDGSGSSGGSHAQSIRSMGSTTSLATTLHSPTGGSIMFPRSPPSVQSIRHHASQPTLGGTAQSIPNSNGLSSIFRGRGRSHSVASTAPKLPTSPPREPSLPPGSQSSTVSDYDSIDPRDHVLIKEAFDAMLTGRFINHSPLALLPFYLSMHLQDVRSHIPLQFLLPSASPPPPKPECTPRSGHERRRTRSSSILEGQKLQTITETGVATNEPNVAQERPRSTHSRKHSRRTSAMFIDSGAEMHLGRTLATVVACKEAIWESFRIREPELDRNDFDALFANYEMDLTDRMNLRSTVRSRLGWCGAEGFSPVLEEWKRTLEMTLEALALQDGPDIPEIDVADITSPEICRSIRGFVGCRPLD